MRPGWQGQRIAAGKPRPEVEWHDVEWREVGWHKENEGFELEIRVFPKARVVPNAEGGSRVSFTEGLREFLFLRGVRRDVSDAMVIGKPGTPLPEASEI